MSYKRQPCMACNATFSAVPAHYEGGGAGGHASPVLSKIDFLSRPNSGKNGRVCTPLYRNSKMVTLLQRGRYRRACFSPCPEETSEKASVCTCPLSARAIFLTYLELHVRSKIYVPIIQSFVLLKHVNCLI